MIPIDSVVLTVNATLLIALLADMRERRRRHCANARNGNLDEAVGKRQGNHVGEELALKLALLPAESREEATAIRRPMRFLIPSLLLVESYRHVCPPPARIRSHVNGFREEFHYATGLLIDPLTCVVTHIVPVQYARQSAGGLRVADGSNIAALANLDRLGLPLLMHFHSHPGFGRDANRPSSVDRAFQERLERGGHRAIGGIFSRDGFVRFFADDLDRFVVEICGKNVHKVGDNEFQIQLDDESV